MSNVYPLPCPVCGTTGKLMTEKECGPIPEFNHYQITCTGCGFGMKKPVQGEDEAIRRWNQICADAMIPNVYPLPCPNCKTVNHLPKESYCIGWLDGVDRNRGRMVCSKCGFAPKNMVRGDDAMAAEWNRYAEAVEIARKLRDTQDQLDQICADAQKLG